MSVDTVPLNGFLLVDKPSGPTSYDVIRVIKRFVKGTKIGHCGTLDPLASGLLILLFGKFTKTQAHYMGQDKVYRALIQFGVKTDSADITGKIIETSSLPHLHPETITAVLSKMTGQREQYPPMYSAIKVGGTPLYKLARKGQVIERKSRPITIYKLDLLEVSHPDTIEIRVHCSSGTYIRTLAEEIGEAFQSVATMKGLVREQIGPFRLEKALPGASLFQMSEAEIRNHVQVSS